MFRTDRRPDNFDLRHQPVAPQLGLRAFIVVIRDFSAYRNAPFAIGAGLLWRWATCLAPECRRVNATNGRLDLCLLDDLQDRVIFNSASVCRAHGIRHLFVLAAVPVAISDGRAIRRGCEQATLY